MMITKERAQALKEDFDEKYPELSLKKQSEKEINWFEVLASLVRQGQLLDERERKEKSNDQKKRELCTLR